MPHSPPVPWPKLTQRQAILVRLAIYLPLIAYFGWGALRTWRAEAEARARPGSGVTSDATAPALPGTPKQVALPDGSTITVYEMTEDEARAAGLDPEAARTPAAP